MSKFNSNNKRSAKLTAGKVLELREKYVQGVSQGALAREFGVSVGQVGRIVRGEAWGEFYQPKDPKLEELQAVRDRGGTLVSEEEALRSQERFLGLMEKASPAPPPSENCDHGVPFLEFCVLCAKASVAEGADHRSGETGLVAEPLAAEEPPALERLFSDMREKRAEAEVRTGDKLLEEFGKDG
jgi:DNA-binding transcriptional regulator YiaG